jgi:hypothetical protein
MGEVGEKVAGEVEEEEARRPLISSTAISNKVRGSAGSRNRRD